MSESEKAILAIGVAWILGGMFLIYLILAEHPNLVDKLISYLE
jgi:hypothetical protein